jgi:hypothetical protein
VNGDSNEENKITEEVKTQAPAAPSRDEKTDDAEAKEEKTFRKCILLKNDDIRGDYAVIGATESSLIIAFRNVAKERSTTAKHTGK